MPGGSKSGGSSKSECVRVVVRCRPFNSKEKGAREVSVIECDTKLKQLYVSKPQELDSPPKTFSFDAVYPPGTSQTTIWNETAKAIVDSTLEGYNGTIFAYGQTGTGKTYTMEGVVGDDELQGIMPNAFSHIMSAVADAGSNMEFLVRTSFLEIYNDQVYDLLAKTRKRMEIREKRDSFGKPEIFVKDLQQFVVRDVEGMMKILSQGQKIRKTGATGMNAGSSRSHSIFTVTIESCERGEDGKKMFKVGKLNMVDLAGSERQKKTAATGQRLVEGNAINQSLSALGNVIKALVSKGVTHVPFRDSKLTRLLQNSLGGNTKTVMVANIGPAGSNVEETMSTLRYASRAKSIKNKPRVNEDPKDAMLKKCQDEIEELRRQLAMARGGGGGALGGAAPGGSGALGPGGEQIVKKVVYEDVVQDTGLTAEDKKRAEQEVLQKLANSQKHAEQMKKVMLLRKKGDEAAAKKLEAELEEKKRAIDSEKERLASIASKLKEKTRLLMKGQRTLEEARKQKAELKRAEEDLRRRQEAEEKLQKKLSGARERELFLEEQYASAQDELADKTQKLKELFLRFREKQRDVKDLQDEWEVERQDLIDNMQEMDQQLKLRELILSNYVPARWLEVIEKYAHYNEYTDEWNIPGIQYASNNVQPDAKGRPGAEAYARQIAANGAQFDPMRPMEGAALGQATAYGEPEKIKENVYFTYGVDIQKAKRKKKKHKSKRDKSKSRKKSSRK